MAYKKAYRIVRTAVFAAMLIMFLTVDAVVMFKHRYELYLWFVPIELLFVFLWWLLLVKLNNNSILDIRTDKGKIYITTLKKEYFVYSDDITVKKGIFYHTFYFSGEKLRAVALSKSVKRFLHKYQKHYKTTK